jgi:hypothetical protein
MMNFSKSGLMELFDTAMEKSFGFLGKWNFLGKKKRVAVFQKAYSRRCVIHIVFSDYR